MMNFHDIIEKYFEIIDEKIDDSTFTPIFAVKSKSGNDDVSEAFNRLYEEIQEYNFVPKLVHKIKEYDVFESFPPDVTYIVLNPQIKEETSKRTPKKSKIWINWVLFGATLIMVVISGYFYIYIFDPIHGGVNSSLFESVIYIILFSVSILGIVGIHEFGHIFAMKKYKLKPSMPYFIPAIPPLGTFGAFVNQKIPPKNRNQLYDIGISGPIAGFIIALIFTIVGLLLTVPVPTDQFIYSYMQTHNAYFSSITYQEAAERIAGEFNNYNLFIFLFKKLLFGDFNVNYYSGQLLPDHIIQIHPLAFGGWIGLLLTALNALPAGKLDGGHVARAVFGRFYWIGTIIGVIVLFFIDFFMVFILVLLGGFSRHPGPLNDTIEVSKSRKIGYVRLIIIIIFTIPVSALTSIYGFL
jgi:Zn-dependent protease